MLNKLRSPKRSAKNIGDHEKEYLGVRATCSMCRNEFYTTDLSKVCPSCVMTEKVRYSEIRDYIYNNPGTTVDYLVNNFGVTRQTIKRYLKDCKLEISDKELGHFLMCESCRMPINTGRYCTRCESMAGKTVISKTDSNVDNKFRTKQM